MPMQKLWRFIILSLALSLLAACDVLSDKQDSPDSNLTVVIIRHAEKPAFGGDNLSCQGQNRATKLPEIITKKFGKPDYIYVPALKSAKSTAHSRMFQTATPLAIKYDIPINSQYSETDYGDIANSVFKKTGTVLMVWSHSEIPALAEALGMSNAPDWEKKDFDSVWILTYADKKPLFRKDVEEINPSLECNF